jgi:hypothetical protein
VATPKWQTLEEWKAWRAEGVAARKKKSRSKAGATRVRKSLRHRDYEAWKEQRRPIIPHGTNAGYFRHRRMKEPACGPCKAAHAQATKENRHRRGK